MLQPIDLKPANFDFVLVRGQLKLIYFGIANAIVNDTTNIQQDHQIGTVNYMSPEAIELPDGHGMWRLKSQLSLRCLVFGMHLVPLRHYHSYPTLPLSSDLICTRTNLRTSLQPALVLSLTTPFLLWHGNNATPSVNPYSEAYNTLPAPTPTERDPTPARNSRSRSPLPSAKGSNGANRDSRLYRSPPPYRCRSSPPKHLSLVVITTKSAVIVLCKEAILIWAIPYRPNCQVFSMTIPLIYHHHSSNFHSRMTLRPWIPDSVFALVSMGGVMTNRVADFSRSIPFWPGLLKISIGCQAWVVIGRPHYRVASFCCCLVGEKAWPHMPEIYKQEVCSYRDPPKCPLNLPPTHHHRVDALRFIYTYKMVLWSISSVHILSPSSTLPLL